MPYKVSVLDQDPIYGGFGHRENSPKTVSQHDGGTILRVIECIHSLGLETEKWHRKDIEKTISRNLFDENNEYQFLVDDVILVIIEKMDQKITRPQFKNSLKTLSSIKGGVITDAQKTALDNVISYVDYFFPQTKTDGLLYSRIDDRKENFRGIRTAEPECLRSLIWNLMIGSEEYLVQTMNCLMLAVAYGNEEIETLLIHTVEKIKNRNS